MRTPALSAFGALCGLATVASAIPALKYSGIVESCGVTTVYVTVAPTSSKTATVQLPNTPPVNCGGVANPSSASTAQSGISEASVLGSGSEVDTTSTAHLTSTVHQTVFLTKTVSAAGTTRTETIAVTYGTSSSLPAEYTFQTYAGASESSSSTSALMVSSSPITTAQASTTAYGNYVYPIVTIKPQPACSDDLVSCPETSVLNSLPNSSAEASTTNQLTESTSAAPEVYVVETLTIIPLATLPSISSSTDQPTTFTVQSTMFSTTKVTITDVAASTLIMASIVYITGLSGIASLGSGSGGWNMSTSSSSVSLSSSSLPSIRTSISTTLAIDTLPSATSTTLTYSSESINFSNSYLFSNVTSALVAQSGFTALPISSTPSNGAGASSSSRFQSLTSTSSNLAQTTGAAWTESCSETDSSTSAIDALQSTVMPSKVTASFTTSSHSMSGPTQTTSGAAWTELCSEDNSTTSATDAGQSTVMPMSGTSSSSFSSTSYSSSFSFLSSASLSSYPSSTGFSSSGSITAQTTSSAQSTSSDFSASTLSSFSSVSTAASSSQLSSPSSSASTSTTTTTTTMTSTSTTSFSPTVASSAHSNITSKASPANTTSSGFSTSSSLSSLSFAISSGSLSGASSAIAAKSTSMNTSISTTSVVPSSASSASLAEDTCTESIAPTSSSSTSPTPNSSILTFTTLISSASLPTSSSSASASSMTSLSATTASSTSSSSPEPTVCGEHGAFTLNFDDLPPLSVKDNSTAQPMPLFSPYHQFYFSDGWTIVPPPTDPYNPSSGRLLVEFLADPDSALGYIGALGNGKNALLGCFNFNALGMSLGCDSMGPNCDWQFTGLRYNNVTKATDTITSQMISTAACVALSNCTLVPVFLDSTFVNLTELRINVTFAGVEKI